MSEKRMSVYTVDIDYGDKHVYIHHIDEESANTRAESINNSGDSRSARVITAEVDTVFLNSNIRDEYQRRVSEGEPLIWEDRA